MMTEDDNYFIRITPAGAGKTNIKIVKIRIRKDHPRRCGENLKPLQSCVEILGSPPQVRGKLVSILVFLQYPRITPAGAGKTMGLDKKIDWTEDHPRRCGENRKGVDKSDTVQGSPPQVRGKQCMCFAGFRL